MLPRTPAFAVDVEQATIVLQRVDIEACVSRIRGHEQFDEFESGYREMGLPTASCCGAGIDT